MLQTLKQALETSRIRFERFAFAYCRKDPKRLGGLRAFSWQNVDAGLREILTRQLTQVVAGGTPEKCYEARLGAEPVRPAESRVPEVTAEEAAQPVGAILQDLVTANPNLDGVRKAMGQLAAKYLALPSTQTAVLCLVLFKMDLPQGGEREYCFLTLVDGEESSTILMYENDNLVTRQLADVFREKQLTRGALYPWSDQPAYNDQAIYLHVERDVAFWSQVLESRRVEPTSGEQREALLRMVAEMGLSTGLVTQLRAAPTPVLGGRELYAAACALQPDFPMSEEQVTARFHQILPQGRVEKAALLQSGARDLTVVAGPGIEIKLASAKLDRIRQVRHGDRRYLVIDLDGNAVVTRGKGQAPLREVDWDEFVEGRG